MKKNLIIATIFSLISVSFNYIQKGKEQIIYFLPSLAEEKAIEYIKTIHELKGDTIKFYATMSIQSDTTLLSIWRYDKRINRKDKLFRLVQASNRFIKVGNYHIPLIFYLDFEYCTIINSKNINGGVERVFHSGNYYSIVFIGKSYEKGKVVWAGFGN